MNNHELENVDTELQHKSQMVFMLEELNENKDKSYRVDTRMFVIFDVSRNAFVVYGKRDCEKLFCFDNPPFAFAFDKRKDVYLFLESCIGPNQFFNAVLYNFNNISDMDSEDLTFEYFNGLIHPDYEITGFDFWTFSAQKDRVKAFLANLENTAETVSLY
jgi:hypothetical protein